MFVCLISPIKHQFVIKQKVVYVCMCYFNSACCVCTATSSVIETESIIFVCVCVCECVCVCVCVCVHVLMYFNIVHLVGSCWNFLPCSLFCSIAKMTDTV